MVDGGWRWLMSGVLVRASEREQEWEEKLFESNMYEQTNCGAMVRAR